MRVFVLVFTRARHSSFLKSSAWKGVFVVRRCFLRVNFFAISFGMRRSISVSELSTENGVAVENAYGSIIGDDQDHVDHSTTEVC